MPRRRRRGTGFASSSTRRSEKGREAVAGPVDTAGLLRHSMQVVVLSRRLLAGVLSLALSAGSLALCAGWAATPEARVACCSEAGACPMHKPDSQRSGAQRAVTQAQADSCCASSEGDDSTPSAPAFALSLSVAAVPSALPVVTPAVAVHLEAWRALVPLPGTRVPRHLLLSVFLL